MSQLLQCGQPQGTYPSRHFRLYTRGHPYTSPALSSSSLKGLHALCVPLLLQGSLDNINLFSCITIISFFLLLPVALLTEGVRFTPAAMRASGLEPAIVMKKAVIAAMCFHAYQQVGLSPMGDVVYPRLCGSDRDLPDSYRNCITLYPGSKRGWLGAHESQGCADLTATQQFRIGIFINA